MANETYTNFTTNTSVTGICGQEDLGLTVDGTWDSATLTLSRYSQTLFDADADGYVVVDSWTANLAKTIRLGAGTQYKLATSGGGGSLDLDALHGGVYKK